jgi:hypothetical protein
MSEAHFEFFKVWPENYGKFPDVPEPPVPPEPPTPPTPPIPPNPTTCGVLHWYDHFDKTLNFRAAWAHLMGGHK